MAIQIAMFNHKGGVSKTTSTFHLGWMLAELGETVLLVDADPQCNLSGLILDFKGPKEFERFYNKEPDRNLLAGLSPAFESKPREIEAVDPIRVPNADRLYLLPGHIRLSENEVTLGIAQELSSSLQALKNLPGSLHYLIQKTASAIGATVVIIDMNPSLSSINQNLLMTSDYFIVPTTPDYFSVMAISSLATVLPKWHLWSTKARSLPVLEDAVYPFPVRDPKFLGTIVQKYRPRKGAPTIGFQKWIDDIGEIVHERLVPTLQKSDMTLPAARYRRITGFVKDYCLVQIPDFNSLIASSQEHRTPVFALTNAQLDQVGVVLASTREKQAEFRELFNQLASRVLTLTGKHAASNRATAG